MLEQSRPAKIDRCICSTWIVFSDGALETINDTHCATIGAVLISLKGNILEYFGLEIPSPLLDEFFAESDHPIYEVEILAALVALLEWTSLVRASQLVVYIDNEACRSAFIQGVGATTKAKEFLSIFDNLEFDPGMICWFGRVPSHSNTADKPSRFLFDDPIRSSALKKDVQIRSHLCQLGLAAGVMAS